MSRQNKVNPNHYTQAGRLSADDLAREYQNQRTASGGKRGEKAGPRWMANDAAPNDADDEDVDVMEAEGAANEDLDDAVAGGPDVRAEGERNMPAPKAKTARGAKQRAQAARRTGTGTARKTVARQEQTATTRDRKPASRATKKGRARKAAGLKRSGASGTPKSGKAPRARGTATRAASPQRAGRPGAHKTASRGTQKATGKKGTPGGPKAKEKSAAKTRKR